VDEVDDEAQLYQVKDEADDKDIFLTPKSGPSPIIIEKMSQKDEDSPRDD